jgi:hypothetical protein
MIKDKIITSTSRGRFILILTNAAFRQLVNYSNDYVISIEIIIDLHMQFFTSALLLAWELK